MAGLSKPLPRPCDVCSIAYQPRIAGSMYCGPVCKNKAKDIRGYGPYCCKGCQNEFRAKRTDRTSYCSRQCAAKYKAEIANRASELLAVKAKAILQEVYAIRRLGKQTYFAPKYRTICPSCDVVHITERTHPRQMMAKVCDACIAETDRALRRVARSKRRAKIRTTEVDSIDPIKVFERDAYLCYLCNEQLDANDRGTIKPLAPELDHIIPISKGGPHIWDNVACACRQCNQAKSDTVLIDYVL
jgi:5-methylcytosine-specific restriction endonuclease McrA